MSLQIKYDLPPRANFGNSPLLLDSFAGYRIEVPQAKNTGVPQPTGGQFTGTGSTGANTLNAGGAGVVITEKYAINKGSFTPLKIGTESTEHNGFYVVSENNFTDLRNGMFSFDREVANVPGGWVETRLMNFTYILFRFVIVTQAGETTIEAFESNVSTQVSARVFHSYTLGYPSGVAGSISLKDPVFQAGDTVPSGQIIRPTEVQVYLGEIYEVLNYELIQSFEA
jgi:hypothetical protein